MRFIPIAAIIKHKSRIRAKIADACAALHAADDKLGQVADEYDDTNSSLATTDLLETRLNARIFAGMLERGDTPTLSRRVFHAIASYGNQESGNTPHVEGAIIALLLAERSLESALELAEQLDGAEIDEPYELPFAALGTIRAYGTCLRCQVLNFDEKEALDAIVAAKRTLALAAA